MMDIIEENNRFAINEYQYNLEKYMLESNRDKYNKIYIFLKKWLEIKNINIKSISGIQNIAINKLPSLEETYNYYINNTNQLLEEFNIKNNKIIDKEDYEYFFKFIRKILKKINYSLIIKQNKLTIKLKKDN